MSKTQGATVTLIRGRNYSVIHPTDRRKGATRFERGVAVFVEDDEVIKACEEMIEVVIDGDNEEVEKPMFMVERGDQTIEGRAAASKGPRTRGRTARRVS